MASGEFCEFALGAARILEAQDGTATDRAALRFERAAGQRRERHREGFTARAQGLDRMIHGACFAGIEPAAKRQNAMRLGDADDRRVAVYVRLV